MRVPSPARSARAWFAGLSGSEGVLATDLTEFSADVRALERGGWWAVVITFEGEVKLWRFATVRPAPLPVGGTWVGPSTEGWTSSLEAGAYRKGVQEIRERIRAGDVYQVNLCRVMSAPIGPDPDVWALANRLAAGNPAPYAGVIDVPDLPGMPGLGLVSASPELFLARDQEVVASSPIKGTATTAAGLLPKDEAENVMIVDLVRNDLHRACRPDSVEVTSLLRVEEHPGLVHLVSTVQGRLAQGAGWPELLEATMPPGSVSGAPKSSALRIIEELEPTPRGPYCGAVGWINADEGTACLAVGIRTFWTEGDQLSFGTGAGITWGSDPAGEWAETELKAARLIGLASAPH